MNTQALTLVTHVMNKRMMVIFMQLLLYAAVSAVIPTTFEVWLLLWKRCLSR